MINININSVYDPFYRYKTPKLVIKHEGDRTILVNIKEISYALKRNYIEVLSYFGHNLGTQCSDKKEKCSIKCSFTPDIITDLLYKYIGEYVL